MTLSPRVCSLILIGVLAATANGWAQTKDKSTADKRPRQTEGLEGTPVKPEVKERRQSEQNELHAETAQLAQLKARLNELTAAR